MTTKSTLKQAEWDLLKTSPQWVEAMLTSYRAGGGGLVGKRYQHILDKVLSEYKTTNPLVKEVLDYNEDPKIDSATTQDQARQKLEQIGSLLEKKVDPPDADAIREFLLAIGQKFAEETGEGLFGLGSDVSKKEIAILDSVRTALKATDADKQQRADDAKARAEAEAKTKAAEEARKKQEAEAKAKAAEEARKKQEAEAKATEEARKKQEAEAKAKAEAEAKAAEEARKKQEAEAKAKAEAEAKAAEEARKKQEAEAKAKAEAEAKAKAAEEARKKQEADTKPTMAVPKAEPAKVESKPATAPTPVQATAARIYEVKPGDSLSKIALEVYGNAGRWPEIFEANKDQIKNPNLIHPGQKLRIP
ncbi:MAG: LysM peptidoglycan-binding domain-containing protein [Anaerolineae bacterium]|nr:LysM peptidoglycan-binding domain-containing protein [Anaerolineae bacterium]MCB9106114.1 LysM peptidoglycan-binding domain-containing protein [Anaerolineales bacterium]